LEGQFYIEKHQKGVRSDRYLALATSVNHRKDSETLLCLFYRYQAPSASYGYPLDRSRGSPICQIVSYAEKVALLERAVLRLAMHFEIQSFESQGLRTAITQEKKRRQWNKRLNLLSEQDEGVPQFFSPQRVLAAKVFQENKEVAEEEDKRQRALQKEEAACKRQEMKAENQERAIQCQLRQIANNEEKEAEKTRKALEKEEKRRQKEQDKRRLPYSLGVKKSRKYAGSSLSPPNWSQR
jgi:hypothetical protein